MVMVGVGIVILVTVAGVVIQRQYRKPEPPVKPATNQQSAEVSKSIPDSKDTQTPGVVLTTKMFKASEVAGVSSKYSFSAMIPSNWEAEYVTATDAINLYDPAAAGESNLEKSQIFIRNFSGNDFLTLSTVTIFSRTSTTVAGRPGVRYDIEKKAGVALFPNQPSWRSERHIVTDIRVGDKSPSVFYVIAQKPGLEQSIYDQFLESLLLTEKTVQVPPAVEGLLAPVGTVEEMKQRITKKPFGLLVSPTDSPVQPERFSGYHNAIDIEYGDKPNQRIEVRMIADGLIVRAGEVDGYGGMVMALHTINGQERAVVYGHLKISELPKVGASLNAGQVIGVFGEGGSRDSDGERKHLHFGVRVDAKQDIRGYVSAKSELAGWLDPLTLF